MPEPATCRTREPRCSSSHTTCCSSTGMPVPVSATSTTTQRCLSMTCSFARSSTVSVSDEYLIALPSRLRIADSSRSSSPSTSGSFHGARATVATIMRSSAPGAVRASSTAWWTSTSMSTRWKSIARDSTSASFRRSASRRATRRADVSIWRAAAVMMPWSGTSSSAALRTVATDVRRAVRGFLSSWSRRMSIRLRRCIASASARACVLATSASRVVLIQRSRNHTPAAITRASTSSRTSRSQTRISKTR